MENKSVFEEWGKYPIEDIEICNKAVGLVAKYESSYTDEDRKIAQDYIEENGQFIPIYWSSIMIALLKTKKGENMLDHLMYCNGNLGEFNFESNLKDGK